MAILSLLGSLLLLLPQAEPRPGSGKAPGKVAEFALLDAQGRRHTRKDWEGRKAIVLYFLGTECPVSNGYAPLMQRLAMAYGSRGVVFYGIHPDPDVTAANALRHGREYRLTFPLLLDPAQVLTRQIGPRVVPEAAVLMPTGEVLYRGRLDDRYTPDGKRREEARTRDLEDALQSVLAGKRPAVAETQAFGCPLPRPRTAP